MSASRPTEWTVAQLAQAVERGQLELHYQPIVYLRSDRIVGAEGVETSASLDLLRQADCDTGQGFLFAKPMPAAAFAVFVSQWRGATMNVNEPTASCCVCCKEIPLDAAFTPEGAVYVEHFCGLECYQRFQARANTANEISTDPNAGGLHPSD